MTYNVFGVTLNLAQSINAEVGVFYRCRWGILGVCSHLELQVLE